MYRRSLIPALGIMIALIAPASAMAAPKMVEAPSWSSGGSGSSGPPAVGNQTYCDGGSWESTVSGQPLYGNAEIYLDTAGGTPLNPESPSTYTPVPANIGHELVCNVTVTDPSDDTSVTQTITSEPVLPDPAVVLTAYSGAVSGNIGESVAGVDVTLALASLGTPSAPLASASAITNAQGGWSAILSPESGISIPAVANAGDLTVSYTAPAGQTTAVPDSTTYAPNFYPTATIAADGTSITTGDASSDGCAAWGFLVNGTAASTVPATQSYSSCLFTLASPLTDEDDVQSQYTSSYTDQTNDSLSQLTTVSDLGLLGGVDAGRASAAAVLQR